MTDKYLESLAKILLELNVKFIFGITGSGRSIKLINFLTNNNVKFINTHHEASAAIIAGAINRSSTKKALSISIKGPGLINSIPGISFNNFENINSISISEEYDSPAQDQKVHKRINNISLLNQFTKGIFSMDYIVENKSDFYNFVNSDDNGPIHINLSFNKLFLKNIKSKYKAKKISKEKIEIIKQSKKPLIIFGKEGIRFFKNSLNTLQVPFLISVASLENFNIENDYYSGVFTGEGKSTSTEFNLIKECDLIIYIGLKKNEITGTLNKYKNNISITNKNFLTDEYIQETYACSEKEIIYIHDQIIEKWNKEKVLNYKFSIKEKLLANVWSPSKCYEIINKQVSKCNCIIDTGNFAVEAEHILSFSNKRKYFGSSISRFMGTAIPTSIGVSFGNESIPTFCFVGDGGISPYLSDLKIIHENQLSICIIFISDGGYGSVAKSAPRDSATQALYMKSPSWIKIIKEFKINSFESKNAEEFSKNISQWNCIEPLFLECTFNKQEYINQTNEIR